MSNFLTRLVDRTLGLSEVVQPSIVPIFAGEVTIGNVSSMRPPLAERNSDLEENGESSQLPGTEAPSSRTDFLPICSERDKSTVPEKTVPSGSFTDNQTGSKCNIVAVEGKQLSAIPFLPKKEVGRKLSSKLRKPESRDGLSPERETKEVISSRIETSSNVALSEKPDLCTVGFDAKKKMKRGLTSKSKKLPNQDSSSPDGDTNSVGPEEMKAPEDVALTVKPDLGATKSYNAEVLSMYSPGSPSVVKTLQDTDKEAPSLASLVFERVIPAEAYVKRERTGPSKVHHHSDEGDVFSALPNIKVTIGRIVVRAVKEQASSPSRRQKVAQAPKLSLDDYLKERNRGDR